MRHLVKTVAMLALALSCSAQTSRPQPVATDTNIIAVVLGKQISASETNELTGIIFGSLIEQFTKENRIEPTAGELDALIRKTDESLKQSQTMKQEERAKLIEELKNPSLSGSEREQKEARLKKLERTLKYMADSEKESMENEEQARSMKRELALSFARPWKINQALYRKYGGRVVSQKADLLPVDAYRDFLKEQEKKGNFKILNKTCAASFWGYFTNDSGHIFYSKEEGAKFMNTPWWMMEQSPEK